MTVTASTHERVHDVLDRELPWNVTVEWGERIVEDLGLGEAEQMDLIHALECEFGVIITDADWDSFMAMNPTVGGLCELIEQLAGPS